MNMKKVLIVNGHPTYEKSFSNKILLQEFSKSFTGNLVIHELSKEYPDYVIDVAKEQAGLKQADVVILSFPFFWYSVPAILKKWIDDVLVYGFAYGPGGDKVRGKKLLYSFTTGGDESSYTKEGHNKYSISEITAPLVAIAKFIGMEVDIVYTAGVLYSDKEENEIRAKIMKHSQRLIELCGV